MTLKNQGDFMKKLLLLFFLVIVTSASDFLDGLAFYKENNFSKASEAFIKAYGSGSE